MSNIENYLAPSSIEDAAAALAAGPATIVAGGTDLMLQTGSGQKTYAPTLINIQKITEMRGISKDGDTIRIGALTTITDLLTDAIIAEHLPVLATMADKFASDQIRNASSIGGNICNASPAGDSIVPMLMYKAEVVLVASTGTRKVPLNEFFTGPGKSVIQENELLIGVDIAVPPAGFKGGFGKFGPRPALEIAMASVSVGGVVKDGVISDVRVAFGAVAPTPIRSAETEVALEGKKLDEETISAAGEVASSSVNPITDVRASDWYRRHLIRVMTEEILNDVS
tara:strand:- start:4230 stop:5078 length:849 start_codon:yes stop_codon:yes gene_type:complete